jgi:cytoskeletal protein RodZ
MDKQALGRYLRESREAKELTLEQAVNALRIRRTILDAFEQGDFAIGGSPVQIRGLLRNYARYLELDEERVLQYYDAALVEKPPSRWRRPKTEESVPVAPRRVTDTPKSLPVVPPPTTLSDKRARRSRNWLGSCLTTLVGLVALSVILFVVGDTLNKAALENATLTPTEVALNPDSLTPSATYTASWTPHPDMPTLTQIALPGVGNTINVTVEYRLRTWVRVLVDGEAQFEGIVPPDTIQSYAASAVVVVRAANAAALNITLNGLSKTDFGTRGQLIELELSSRGFQIVQQSEGSSPIAETLIDGVPMTPLVPEVQIEPTLTQEMPTLLPIPTEAGGQAAGSTTNNATPTTTGSIASAQDVPVSDAAPQTNGNSQADAPTPLPIMTEAKPAANAAATISPPVTAIPLPGTAPASPMGLPSPQPQTGAAGIATMTASPTATSNLPTAVLPIRATQNGQPTPKQP